MVQKTILKSGLAPLVLIWLAVHAVLLALVLSLKFLTAKMVIVAMLLGAAMFFLWRQLRAAPRRMLGHAA